MKVNVVNILSQDLFHAGLFISFAADEIFIAFFTQQ